MKQGHLSNYFQGIAAKQLSSVEADPVKSNQHEFNVTKDMLLFLGREERKDFKGKFLYFNDENEFPIISDASLTLYDARANHKTRTEYRLYFQNNESTNQAKAGDQLIIAKSSDNQLLIIITEKDSTRENQLQWLFGINKLEKGFKIFKDNKAVGYAATLILEEIGIEVKDDADDFLDYMIKNFGSTFPATKVFSNFARSTVKNISPENDPDNALQVWMEQEEKLFRAFEKHLLLIQLTKLQKSKTINPDDYMSLLMSFQQRRKARAGSALENHLESIFTAHSIKYDRTKVTEGKKKPDFIFPAINEYHQSKPNDPKLTVLAAKTTCKDRWRQILNEANKIKMKHLITFEPSISQNQLDEMKAENVQLVIPLKIQETFTKEQQKFLISLKEFLQLLKKKQEK